MPPVPDACVYIATSLDGYIARPDGGLDWLESVSVPGEDYGYATFFASVDALLMGRGTWDTVHTFDPWPYAGKRVLVATSRPLEARNGEEVVHGPVRPIFERLAAEGVRRVYVDGGNLIRRCLTEGLVTEVTLSIIPRILGAGIPLFDSPLPELGLTLVDARGFDSGLVQVRYRWYTSRDAPPPPAAAGMHPRS